MVQNLLDYLPPSLLTSPTTSPFSYLDPTSSRIVSTLNKRCRTLVHEIYDRTARALLKRIGFDPDDINKEYRIAGWAATPLIFFSAVGDLQMCRYLFFRRGADCRKTESVHGSFPLYWAAGMGHLQIVQFLYHRGSAHQNITGKPHKKDSSPLRKALHANHFHVVQWLIRNGALALSNDVDGVINDATMRNDLRPSKHRTRRKWDYDKRLPILAWAQDAIAILDNVQLFLTGTILSAPYFRRHPNNPYATRSNHKRMRVSPTSSPLVMLKGKSGILELIAHFVAGTPQQLRTLRQLIDRLPAFIADVPFVVVEERRGRRRRR